MAKLKIQDKEIEYTVRKSKRAKNVSVTVACDATVLVTCPWFVSEKKALTFLIHKFDWVFGHVEKFKKLDTSLLRKGGKRDYIKNKANAYHLVKELAEKYSSMYGFTYKRISIRNQKTRWGSCSKEGNLNFNYKILFLPERIAEYIVVHELCHLKELNHSKNFWDLVAQTIPDHKVLRKELRKKII